MACVNLRGITHFTLSKLTMTSYKIIGRDKLFNKGFIIRITFEVLQEEIKEFSQESLSPISKKLVSEIRVELSC